jgi:hypothetical protein
MLIDMARLNEAFERQRIDIPSGQYEALFDPRVEDRSATVYVDIQAAAEAFCAANKPGTPLDLPSARSPFRAATLAWSLPAWLYPGERNGRLLDRALRYRTFMHDGLEYLWGTAFSWRTRAGVEPIGQVLIPPDKSGSLAMGELRLRLRADIEKWAQSDEQKAYQRAHGTPDDVIEQQTANDVFGSILAPALYGLAVLNCKNVSIPEHAIPRPVRKRLGFHITIKRLEVRPVARREKNEPTGAHPGVARHYCRGHFRDYTAGAGLFGKYHGTYWTPPTWKGRTDLGVVHKSYSVKPPDVHA